MRYSLGIPFLACALALASAQQPSASKPSSGTSSSSPNPATAQEPTSNVHPGAGLTDAGSGSITLESSEALFDIATTLNACGYDSDLANSNPVRAEVRTDVAAAVAESPAARSSQDAVCAYIHDHQLSDPGRTLAQFISLALYLNAPPQLTPIADQTEIPPDALQVINILPLLRSFAGAANLHVIWLKHHAQYEAIAARLHDPVYTLYQGTNIYLKIPFSSYSDRRLLILVEPMLAPSAPNARIYATDYIVVTSPNAAGAVRMDQIRHLYLHYTIEPLVYARASSMQRLTPLLKPVQDAPLDYIYKTDVVALVTECLIKAIEARNLDTGLAKPVRPTGTRARVDLARYDEEMASYDREAETIRRKQVDLEMRQGWTMTEYFYNQLIELEHNPEGLNETMGQMVYGMDVERERHHDEQIRFLPEGSGEYVKRAPRVPTGMMLAEKMMLEGHLDEADSMADKALADPKQDHAQAMYLKARVELMQGDPETSKTHFEEVLKTARDPHTAAWAHIYLGRLYDIKEPTERAAAVTEYKAALTVPGVPQDARAAASGGLKMPFSVPKVKHQEDEPLDPSGKAEKESYKPE